MHLDSVEVLLLHVNLMRARKQVFAILLNESQFTTRVKQLLRRLDHLKIHLFRLLSLCLKVRCQTLGFELVRHG